MYHFVQREARVDRHEHAAQLMDAHDRLAEFDDGIVAELDAYPVAGADVIGSENRGELAAPPFELCISDQGLEPPRRHTRESDPVGDRKSKRLNSRHT